MRHRELPRRHCGEDLVAPGVVTVGQLGFRINLVRAARSMRAGMPALQAPRRHSGRH